MASPLVRWAVSGEGATIEADGGFVAEKPGSYAVTAVSGDRAAVATVTVTARDMVREFEVVGRTQARGDLTSGFRRRAQANRRRSA